VLPGVAVAGAAGFRGPIARRAAAEEGAVAAAEAGGIPAVAAGVRARAGPLVPMEVEAPSLDAPKRISGSTSSAEELDKVGIEARSGALAGETPVESVSVAPESKSINAPCASNSSSESPDRGSLTCFGDGAIERAMPCCESVPAVPKASSTGRSARGSRRGRDAASIIFRAGLGRPIQIGILQCRGAGT
jgi:hypothetical protein